LGGYRQRVDSLKAPSVTLRPMTDPEYDVWREHAIAGYAAAIGPARGLDPQAALQSASDETSKLLPDGRSTAGHLLWTARHEGDPIGTLWISTGSPSAAFIFSVEVDEQYRGRGFGRSIMLAAEQECRLRGFSRLELNVFGDNHTAVALYESLGYHVTSQQMRKEL
jgi:ribosomal protein S18 acetylase RimI-like enzyme